jgi:predicted outer membrane repeat protein
VNLQVLSIGCPVFRDVKFFRNSATAGGAVYMKDCTCDTYFYDCIFDGNSASDNGGALFSSRSTVVVIGGTFVDNTALSGAGVYILAAEMFVDNADFYNNSATGSNGGVLMTLTTTLSMTNSKFRGNSAAFAGGVLHAILTKGAGLPGSSSQILF